MKITKNKLKQIILEEYEKFSVDEQEEVDTSKLKATTRTAGQTGQNVKDVTMKQSGTIDGVERSMIEQIYKFFNELAGKDQIDLQRHRMTIQTSLKRLQTLIDKNETDPQGDIK